jgi:hypothetical protein
MVLRKRARQSNKTSEAEQSEIGRKRNRGERGGDRRTIQERKQRKQRNPKVQQDRICSRSRGKSSESAIKDTGMTMELNERYAEQEGWLSKWQA